MLFEKAPKCPCSSTQSGEHRLQRTRQRFSALSRQAAITGLFKTRHCINVGWSHDDRAVAKSGSLRSRSRNDAMSPRTSVCCARWNRRSIGAQSSRKFLLSRHFISLKHSRKCGATGATRTAASAIFRKRTTSRHTAAVPPYAWVDDPWRTNEVARIGRKLSDDKCAAQERQTFGNRDPRIFLTLEFQGHVAMVIMSPKHSANAGVI
jgi:hypothetical protein